MKNVVAKTDDGDGIQFDNKDYELHWTAQSAQTYVYICIFISVNVIDIRNRPILIDSIIVLYHDAKLCDVIIHYHRFRSSVEPFPAIRQLPGAAAGTPGGAAGLAFQIQIPGNLKRIFYCSKFPNSLQIL